MPIFRHLQPGGDAVSHEWRFVPESNVPPGYGIGVELLPLSETSGILCSEADVQKVCLDLLDEEAPQSDLDLCIIENFNNCYETEHVPIGLPGWVQVRACDAGSCSDWSNPKPVPEFPVDTLLWLAIVLCFLVNAILSKKR